MAGSPYGIRADFHVLDRVSGDDRNGLVPVTEGQPLDTDERGDGLHSGDGPQLSLSSQTSSRRKPIVRSAPRDHNVPNLRDRLPESSRKTGDATVASAVFGGVGFMSMRRIAALQAGLLLVAMFANATSRNNAIRITVLDSETRSLTLGGNDVPKNCDQVNFDAYCSNSKVAILTNTLAGAGRQRACRSISACTIDSKYSRCTPLPKGESFDARREKHGLTVYYLDDKGKARKQLYTLVDTDGKAGQPATAAAVATQPVPAAAAPRQSSPAARASPASWLRAGKSSGEGGEGEVQFQFDTRRRGDHS